MDGEQPRQASRARVIPFFDDVVLPAFAELAVDLEHHGRTVVITTQLSPAQPDAAWAQLAISHNQHPELVFTVKVAVTPRAVVPYAEVRLAKAPLQAAAIFRATPGTDIAAVAKDDVLVSVLQAFRDAIRMNRT